MYQAKLQLRPSDNELYRYVMGQIRLNKIKITKELKLKEGVDIYVNSSKFAFRLCQDFKKKFKGNYKVTRSLYSLNRQRSKKVYRLTVLLRLSKDF